MCKFDVMPKKRHSAAVQQGLESSSMPIGEFDAAASFSGDHGFLASNPLYWLYEMGHAALNPAIPPPRIAT